MKGEENYERPMFNRESHTIANMNLLIAMIWCVFNQIIGICSHMVQGTRVWIPIVSQMFSGVAIRTCMLGLLPPWTCVWGGLWN